MIPENYKLLAQLSDEENEEIYRYAVWVSDYIEKGEDVPDMSVWEALWSSRTE